MKLINKIIVVIFLAGISTIFARLKEVNDSSRLNCLLQKYDLALVYFFSNLKNCDCDDMRQACKEQQCALKDISKSSRYKDAGMGFFQVNMSRNHGDTFEQEFDVTSNPTVMLFKEGEPLVARLEGCATRAKLKDFIEENAENDIDALIKERDEERKRRLQEQLYWYNYYDYPTYGYCGPCSWGPYFCGYSNFWF